MGDAVTSNTETNIDVTYDASRKLNFVVTAAGGLNSVTSDSTLSGDGTAGNPLELADGAVTEPKLASDAVTEPKLAVGNAPQDTQVLSWDATNSRLLWKDDETTPGGTGLTSVSHDTAFGGAGTATDPLTLDETGAAFPVIPLDKGGSGATDAAGARTAFGLGTAAVLDTGIADGEIPILGTGGELAVSTLGAGGATGQVLTRTGTGQAWEDSGAGYTDADVDARLVDRLTNLVRRGTSFADRFLFIDDQQPGVLGMTQGGDIRGYSTANWAQPGSSDTIPRRRSPRPARTGRSSRARRPGRRGKTRRAWAAV